MRPITSVLAISALLLACIPARAALNAYIRVTGVKQGKFKGSGQSRSSRIPVISVEYSVNAPRDAASGQAVGRRIHKPFKILLSSPEAHEFQTALAKNELLPAVQIEFVRPAGAGKVEQYMTIELNNATVTNIERKIGHGGGATSQEELISLSYEKIQTTHTQGKTQSTDDWKL